MGGEDTMEKEIPYSYFQSLYRREGFHRYKDNNGEFQAKLLKVESDGRLLLEDDAQNQRSYLFKEIQYII
jgi:BirA family biotin operon repressor/biotin-[acetyl-CoA-carboxylase] ligase